VPEIMERTTWLGAAGQDAAIGRLDPDFRSLEHPPLAGRRVGFERHALPGALDGDRSPDRHLEQLRLKTGSPACDADLHGLEPVPERGASVRLEYLLGQSEPRGTSGGVFVSHLGCLL
jgi:hypothetical protein